MLSFVILNDAFLSFKVHWHSLPIRSMAWSLDSEHLFSGGGEAALVKWNVNLLVREEIAPRQGSPIANVKVTDNGVLVALEDASIKRLDHRLWPTALLAPFLDLSNVGRSGLLWHTPTSSIVYLHNQRQMNFYNPLEVKVVLSLEISEENLILGERNQDPNRGKQDVLFNFSDSGEHLVTCHDLKVRIWSFNYVDKTFKLMTQILDSHDAKITDVLIYETPSKNTMLVTSSEDGLIKVWGSDDGTTWHLQDKLSHKKQTPKCIAVSPDKSVLAVAFPSSITLWSLKSYELKSVLPINASQPPLSLCFFKDKATALLAFATASSLQIINIMTLQVVLNDALAVKKMRAFNDGQLTIMTKHGEILQVNKKLEIHEEISDIDVLDVACNDQNMLQIINTNGKIISKAPLLRPDLDLSTLMLEDKQTIFTEDLKLQVNAPVHTERSTDRNFDLTLQKPISKSLDFVLRQCV